MEVTQRTAAGIQTGLLPISAVRLTPPCHIGWVFLVLIFKVMPRCWTWTWSCIMAPVWRFSFLYTDSSGNPPMAFKLQKLQNCEPCHSRRSMLHLSTCCLVVNDCRVISAPWNTTHCPLPWRCGTRQYYLNLHQRLAEEGDVLILRTYSFQLIMKWRPSCLLRSHPVSVFVCMDAQLASIIPPSFLSTLRLHSSALLFEHSIWRSVPS